MSPELAKQAAVVLHPEIQDSGALEDVAMALTSLDVLVRAVARWCREKVENGFPGGRLEPCLVYGQMFTIDNRKTEWLWECSFTTAMSYLKLCAKSGKIILGRSDDPATAICLALVEADKKLNKENNNERTNSQ